MRYFKKLVGDRIYLSPRSSEDAEKFTEWLNDFETTDYVGKSGEMISYEWEKNFLEENNSPEATFAIVTLDEDKLIGTVGLESINRTDRKATLGIFIGDKDYRSKGVARFAAGRRAALRDSAARQSSCRRRRR